MSREHEELISRHIMIGVICKRSFVSFALVFPFSMNVNRVGREKSWPTCLQAHVSTHMGKLIQGI